MPKQRALDDAGVAEVLEWGEKWKALETRKEIATRLKVNETTVDRILRDGGYKQRKIRPDVAVLAKSLRPNLVVPCGTNHGTEGANYET